MTTTSATSRLPAASATEASDGREDQRAVRDERRNPRQSRSSTPATTPGRAMAASRSLPNLVASTSVFSPEPPESAATAGYGLVRAAVQRLVAKSRRQVRSPLAPAGPDRAACAIPIRCAHRTRPAVSRYCSPTAAECPGAAHAQARPPEQAAAATRSSLQSGAAPALLPPGRPRARIRHRRHS